MMVLGCFVKMNDIINKKDIVFDYKLISQKPTEDINDFMKEL